MEDFDVLHLGNPFKEEIVNLKKGYLNSINLMDDINTIRKWHHIAYPFDDKELIKLIENLSKLSKNVYERIFEQLRKKEKLFVETIGGKGEVRKELYLPHIGQFIILDAFIRKGEESYTHRHKDLTEVYKVEYGEVIFIDYRGKSHLFEGDSIIFNKNVPHSFSILGEYTVISVIKDFGYSISSLAELKMKVEMDWYSSSQLVPRKDILLLREKRKLYNKIIKEIKRTVNVM